MAKNQMALGIQKTVIDEETGVPRGFHTVGLLTLDFGYGVHSVNINHYFSRELYEAGKKPLGSTRYELYGRPPRGVDAVDWVLKTLTAPVAETAIDAYGQPLQANDFTGAEIVYGDLPQE